MNSSASSSTLCRNERHVQAGRVCTLRQLPVRHLRHCAPLRGVDAPPGPGGRRSCPPRPRSAARTARASGSRHVGSGPASWGVLAPASASWVRSEWRSWCRVQPVPLRSNRLVALVSQSSSAGHSILAAAKLYQATNASTTTAQAKASASERDDDGYWKEHVDGLYGPLCDCSYRPAGAGRRIFLSQGDRRCGPPSGGKMGGEPAIPSLRSCRRPPIDIFEQHRLPASAAAVARSL